MGTQPQIQQMERLNKVVGHIKPEPEALGSQGPDDVVIVSALRTAIGKAGKGSFKDTTLDVLLGTVLKATVENTKVPFNAIGDVVVGNVQTGGSYAGPGRMAQMAIGGFPETVPFSTCNRQCSSGLQAVATIAAGIKAGQYDAGIGAGVESMTAGGKPGSGPQPPMSPELLFKNQLARECLVPMGVTAENVAERYGIDRAQQDQMALESNMKACKAQADGKFAAEIVPLKTTFTDKEGNKKTIVV